MPRRMSNRDRVARMREEAAATRREKAQARAAAAANPARPKRSRAGKPARLMLVWAVKDGHGEVVATFPYARKEAAEAEAQRLKETSRRAHIVCPHKVPFDA